MSDDSFPPDLSSELPAPRQDEPASLRQDILDELADHLACSLQRERVKTVSEQQARSNVLNRFGNPSSIARKLWFDAMREKIMTQRLLLVSCLLMVLVICGLTASFWFVMRQHQQLQQESIAAFKQIVTDLQANQQKEREASASSLAALETAIRERPVANQPPSEWNPVEFKLVRGEGNGPPAANVRVFMKLKENGSGLPPLEEVSGASGIVRFQRVRYGVYQVNLLTEYDASTSKGDESKDFSLTVPVGESVSMQVVCPAHRTRPEKVVLRCDWPEDLKTIPITYGVIHSDLFNPARPEWRWVDYLFTSHDDVIRTDPMILIAPDGKGYFGSDPFSSSQRSSGHFHQLRFSLSEAFDALQLNWPDPDYRLRKIAVLVNPSIPKLAFETIQKNPSVFQEQSAASGSGGGPPCFGMDFPTKEQVLQATSPFLQPKFCAHDQQAGGIPFVGITAFEGASFDATSLSYRIEPGDPGTLVITPSETMIQDLRKFVQECQERLDLAKSLAEKTN